MIIKNNIEEIQNYLSDASNLTGTINIVYIPENQTDLIELIRTLSKEKIPFTISAGGTGMAGGRVAFEGCLISVEKLNNIIEINSEAGWCRVESGVILKDLQEKLLDFNSFYPVNPTENNSFIGGNIANNSSGSRTFKYGATRNWVMELKILLPDGELLLLKRGENFANDGKLQLTTESGKIINLEFTDIYMPKSKNSTGYYLKKNVDAIDVFIGNEGTLGIILESKLGIKLNSEKLLGGIIFFDSKKKLLEFVDLARSNSRTSFKDSNCSGSDISFRLIEYFDNNALNLLKTEYPQVPENSEAAIWFEQEYSEIHEEKLLENVYSLINDYTPYGDTTWIALNDKEHRELSEFRHKLPLLVTDKVASKQFRKIGGDTSVPVEHFHEFYNYLYEIYNESGVEFVVFGHIGDCHLHADIFPKNQEEFEISLQTYDKLIEKTIKLGGSISAEHGIGKIKKKYFEKMMGSDNIDMMKKVKEKIDPNYLLGRGNLFDLV